MTLQQLFRHHLRERLAYLEQALARTGFGALVISSGTPFVYYLDDHEAPFQGVPHFRHYCPLEGAHHLLRLQPGSKPLLVRYVPADYWDEQLPMTDAGWWADEFELTEAPTVDAVWDRIGRPARGACLGDVPDRARAAGLEPNPPALSNLLDWGRSYKSPYEIRCLEEATALGVKGHLAAREAFLAGATEVEIHHAFVTAAGCVDHELAFPSIVALDPKGATLHYRNKRRVGHGRVLLVDCGVRVRGYGSDITRTSTAPACDPRFRDLARALQAVQLKLAGLLKPGLPFPQVHHHAHAELAALLHHAGILKGDLEASLAEGLTRPFMPHGLGHFLGITIHDVAGRFTGPDGAILPPPGHYPALRTTRVLEPRQVVTVEPGLYFIPMLLEPFRQGPQRNRFDWKLIDELTPFGGIRFEDNVVITGDGARNVTRECLPEWEV